MNGTLIQNDIQTSLLTEPNFTLPSPAPSSGKGRRVVFLVGAALAFLGPGGTSTSPSRCEPFRGFGMWVREPSQNGLKKSDEFFGFEWPGIA